MAKFTVKDAWAVALALAGLGVGWMASHQGAVITAVVVAVTWGINVAAKRYNVRLGKRWLTVILYALAVVLELIFEPVGIPAFPAWSGDANAYAQALVGWVSALAAIGAAVTAGATVLYNTLLHEVLAKVGDGLLTK